MATEQPVPRIGIIGVGTYGEMHLKSYTQMQRRGGVKLVAVADTDEATRTRRAEQFAVKTYAGHAEMIAAEELDAVTVATPDHLHGDVVVDALEAGLHVMTEKPMATTVADCRRMLAAAKAAGRLLMVDFHKRYDPWHRDAARRGAAGEIGRVLYASAYMEDRIDVPRDWPIRQWAAHSSPGWFLGVHMFDLLRWITGETATAVSATGIKDKLAGMGIDTYDALSVRVGFASGASATFNLSWVLPDGFEATVNQGIRIVGTEGLVEIDSQDRGAAACTAAGGMESPNFSFYRERIDRHGRVIYEGYGIESICHFAELVAELLAGATLDELAGQYPDGEDGLAVTRIGVAAHASAEAGGRLIELESLE